MTIAYWCVLIAGLMPMFLAAYGKYSGGFQLADNSSPRAFFERAKGKAQRANWAQQNSWEAFAPFAAAVIIANLCHAPSHRIDTAAVIFIVARLVYGLLYITDRHSLRSMVWGIGLFATIALYGIAWLG
jgi:uncharacterized MAPEG superfamily protein